MRLPGAVLTPSSKQARRLPTTSFPPAISTGPALPLRRPEEPWATSTTSGAPSRAPVCLQPDKSLRPCHPPVFPAAPAPHTSSAFKTNTVVDFPQLANLFRVLVYQVHPANANPNQTFSPRRPASPQPHCWEPLACRPPHWFACFPPIPLASGLFPSRKPSRTGLVPFLAGSHSYRGWSAKNQAHSLQPLPFRQNSPFCRSGGLDQRRVRQCL